MKYMFFVTSEKAVSLVDTLTTIFENECRIPEGVLFETDRDDLAGIVGKMEGVRNLFDMTGLVIDATPSRVGIGDDKVVVVPLGVEFETDGIGEGVQDITTLKEPVRVLEERSCLNCGAIFQPKQKRSKYCSKKCNDAYNQKPRSIKEIDHQAEIAAVEDAAGAVKDEKPVCERCGKAAKVLTEDGMCFSCDAKTRQEAAIERVVSAAHASGGRADIVQDRIYNLSGRKVG